MHGFGGDVIHGNFLLVERLTSGAVPLLHIFIAPLLDLVSVLFNRDVLRPLLLDPLDHGFAGPGRRQEGVQRRHECLLLSAYIGSHPLLVQGVCENISRVIAISDASAKVVLDALFESAASIERFGELGGLTGFGDAVQVFAGGEPFREPAGFVVAPVDDGLGVVDPLEGGGVHGRGNSFQPIGADGGEGFAVDVLEVNVVRLQSQRPQTDVGVGDRGLPHRDLVGDGGRSFSERPVQRSAHLELAEGGAENLAGFRQGFDALSVQVLADGEVIAVLNPVWGFGVAADVEPDLRPLHGILRHAGVVVDVIVFERLLRSLHILGGEGLPQPVSHHSGRSADPEHVDHAAIHERLARDGESDSRQGVARARGDVPLQGLFGGDAFSRFVRQVQEPGGLLGAGEVFQILDDAGVVGSGTRGDVVRLDFLGIFHPRQLFQSLADLSGLLLERLFGGEQVQGLPDVQVGGVGVLGRDGGRTDPLDLLPDRLAGDRPLRLAILSGLLIDGRRKLLTDFFPEAILVARLARRSFAELMGDTETGIGRFDPSEIVDGQFGWVPGDREVANRLGASLGVGEQGFALEVDVFPGSLEDGGLVFLEDLLVGVGGQVRILFGVPLIVGWLPSGFFSDQLDERLLGFFLLLEELLALFAFRFLDAEFLVPLPLLLFQRLARFRLIRRSSAVFARLFQPPQLEVVQLAARAADDGPHPTMGGVWGDEDGLSLLVTGWTDGDPSGSGWDGRVFRLQKEVDHTSILTSRPARAGRFYALLGVVVPLSHFRWADV